MTQESPPSGDTCESPPTTKAEWIAQVEHMQQQHAELAAMLGRLAERIEQACERLGVVAFRAKIGAYDLVAEGLKYAPPQELIERWCEPGNGTPEEREEREELRALIRAVSCGCTLGQFLEADSAVAWVQRYAPVGGTEHHG